MDTDRLLCKAQVKDKPNEWVTGYYFCMHHNDDERTHVHHFIIPLDTPLPKDKPIGEIQVEIEPETLCQGSGRYDKNGRPIFENDIHSTPYGGLWVVKFGEYNDTDICSSDAADSWGYGWYMHNKERDEESGFDGNEHEYVNIIGNAIETPELLREQKEAAVTAESPVRLVDAKEVKAKLLRFGFKSPDMTVTEFVEDELTTMAVPTLEATLETSEEATQ